MDTSIIQTLLYNFWTIHLDSEKLKFHIILSAIIQTQRSAPLVSILKKFDCTSKMAKMAQPMMKL